uniref:General transcription factor IIH subunit 4 n=1 Tax=Ciona savignyi TaxID=51511 RepID=H2Y8H1_CIOSA
MEHLQTLKLKCLSLQDYLKGLPPVILDSLYDHPATCMGVFRELPELARYHTMRILYVEQPISKAAAAAWVKIAAKPDHEIAVKSMLDLRVWIETSLQGSDSTAYTVNSVFRRNLQKALVGENDPVLSTSHLGSDKHAKNTESLSNYADERWEAVLLHMVGSDNKSTISQDLKELMLQAGLMKQEHGTGKVITAKGFQFLLLDNATQVWYFVREYLDWIRGRGMNLVQILRFIFELSFSTLGTDLPTDERDEHVLTCLQHFREMGIIMQRKRKSRRFYPTHLAVDLVNKANKPVSTVVNKHGFIVAETNFRVCAYTESDLHYSILSLFCEMEYRFPNMCVLRLTRESVQRAVVNGITADQILHYIKANAHAEMLKDDPILAPTVADQIRLWAMERDRLTYRDGVLYNQFLAQKDFEVLRNYAQWGCFGSVVRYMVVTMEGHDQVKRYWKKIKKES